MTTRMIRVLLVEDNPGDARLLQILADDVREVALEVTLVQTLRDALQRVQHDTFDVGLLDLSLPDSFGLETFEKLYAQASALPILILSGLDDAQLADTAVRKGAQDYLVKGEIDARGLGRAIRYAIERKAAGVLLQESERRFRAVFETIREVYFRLDLTGKVLEISPSVEALTGYPTYAFIGNAFCQYQQGNDQAVTLCSVVQQQGAVDHFEMVLHGRDGRVITAEASAHLALDARGVPIGIEGILHDISERKQIEWELRHARNQLEHKVASRTQELQATIESLTAEVSRRSHAEEEVSALALVDELTHLYNRRGFFTLAEQHLRLVRRLQQRAFLVFLDIDNMKWINDTHGHPEGDRALTATAATLQESFRESDIVARIGGDEFVAFGTASTSDTIELLRGRLLEMLEVQTRKASLPYALTVSMGVTFLDPNTCYSLEEILAMTDQRMYDEKRAKSGATGRMLRPVLMDEPVAPASPVALEAPPSQLEVLLCEDNASDVRLIRELLIDARASDLHLSVVPTLAETLARIRYGGIACILLDLALPDCQGYETFRRVMAVATEIPIVLLTGQDDAQSALDVVRQGAQEYLVKGALTGDLLVRAVRYSIERMRTRALLHQALVRETEQRDQLNMLFQVMPFKLLVVDERLCVERSNDVALHPLDASLPRRGQQTLGTMVRCRHALDQDAGCAELPCSATCALAQGILQTGQTGEPVIQREVQLPTSESQSTWLRVNMVRTAVGNRHTVLVTMENITAHRRAIEELAQNEEMFRSVTQAFPGVVMIRPTELQAPPLYVSDRFESLLGHTRDKLHAGELSILDLVAEEDRDYYLTTIGHRIAQQKAYTVEVRFTRADGGTIWVHEMGEGVYDEDGDLRHIVSTLLDITDRKHTERALHASEQRYRTIFESIPDIYFRTSLDGVVTLCSPSVQQILGYHVHEVIGRSVSELTAMPERLLRFRRLLWLHGEVRDMEITLAAKEGNEIIGAVSAHLIYDRRGVPVAVEGILRDITTRQLAVSASEESARRLRTMLENISLLAVMFDTLGNITFCNEYFCQVTGWSCEEVMGKNWFDLCVPLEQRADWRRHLSVDALTEPVNHATYEILTRTGERRVIHWDHTRLYSTQKTPVGIACIGDDITDAIRTERDLHDTNRLLTTLINASPLAIVSYDTEGQVTSWSAAAETIFGWTAEEVLGTVPPFFTDVMWQEFAEWSHRAHHGTPLRAQQIAVDARNGMPLTLRMFAIPLKDDAQQITGYMGLYENVTDRAQLEGTMEAIESMWSDFVHNISRPSDM